MTDPTEGLLVRAVCADPDDDTVRLAYADWLQEHDETREQPCPGCSEYQDDPENPWPGQAGHRPERDPASGRHEGGWTNCKRCNGGGPGCARPGVVSKSNGYAARAEFIRVQIELARLPAPPDYGPVVNGRYACEACWAVSDREMFRSVPGACPHCGHDKMRKLRADDASAYERADLARRQQELWKVLAKVYRAGIPEGWNVILPGDSTGGHDNHLVIIRGYGGEVRCPLAALFGGEPRYTYDPSSGGDRITGRTLGAAKELFSHHPITKVVLTDREPYHLEYPGRWRWFQGESGEVIAGEYTRAGLPKELFDLVYQDWPPVKRPLNEAHFASRAAAIEALAAACVKLGRTRAGLEKS